MIFGWIYESLRIITEPTACSMMYLKSCEGCVKTNENLERIGVLRCAGFSIIRHMCCRFIFDFGAQWRDILAQKSRRGVEKFVMVDNGQSNSYGYS